MAQELYCWRCQMEIPMLTEDEWHRVAPHFVSAIDEIKQNREKHGNSLPEAMKQGFGVRALAIYKDITGFTETNPNALYHHRISLYGPPCDACGKPLRTPQAKHCAACGRNRT